MRRVLVAGFGEIAAAGIRAILAEPEFIVHECRSEAVMRTIPALGTRSVLLNGSITGSAELAAALATSKPDVTVVVCSADSRTMTVFSRSGPRRGSSRPLSATALVECARI